MKVNGINQEADPSWFIFVEDKFMYEYKPELDQPVAQLHQTDTGVWQLRVYGLTVDSTSNTATPSEKDTLQKLADRLNSRAQQHPDRVELREHREAHALTVPAMRALSAAYQRLLKIIEKTKPIVVMRKNHPINEKSSYLKKPSGLLQEGDKLYRDQFVLPAHVLYTLQRNLHLLHHQTDNGKTINLDLMVEGLKLVENLMTHYGLDIPHPAETQELIALDNHE